MEVNENELILQIIALQNPGVELTEAEVTQATALVVNAALITYLRILQATKPRVEPDITMEDINGM